MKKKNQTSSKLVEMARKMGIKKKWLKNEKYLCSKFQMARKLVRNEFWINLTSTLTHTMGEYEDRFNYAKVGNS